MKQEFRIDGIRVSLNNNLFETISNHEIDGSRLHVVYEDQAQPNIIKEKPISFEETKRKAASNLKLLQKEKKEESPKSKPVKLADTLQRQGIVILPTGPLKEAEGSLEIGSHRLKVKKLYRNTFEKISATVSDSVTSVMEVSPKIELPETKGSSIPEETIKPVYQTEFRPTPIHTIEGLKEKSDPVSTVVPISPELGVDKGTEKKEEITMINKAQVVESHPNPKSNTDSKIPNPEDIEKKIDRAKTQATEIAKYKEAKSTSEEVTRKTEIETQKTLATIDASNKKQAEATVAIENARKSLDEQLTILDKLSSEIKIKAEEAKEEEKRKKELLEVALKEEAETLEKEQKVIATRQTLENANTEIGNLIRQAQGELDSQQKPNTIMFPTGETEHTYRKVA